MRAIVRRDAEGFWERGVAFVRRWVSSGKTWGMGFNEMWLRRRVDVRSSFFRDGKVVWGLLRLAMGLDLRESSARAGKEVRSWRSWIELMSLYERSMRLRDWLWRDV